MAAVWDNEKKNQITDGTVYNDSDVTYNSGRTYDGTTNYPIWTDETKSD